MHKLAKDVNLFEYTIVCMVESVPTNNCVYWSQSCAMDVPQEHKQCIVLIMPMFTYSNYCNHLPDHTIEYWHCESEVHKGEKVLTANSRNVLLLLLL